MKLLIVLNVCLMIFANSFAQAADEQSKQAFILNINGVISPATADYFERSLDKANQADTEFILLKLDTPGGLDLSMRNIIKKIIASPVPIVTYVSPSGSRAASAGTYILYASHIAAMAPATNLGAATPIQILPAVSPTGDKPSPEDETEHEQSDIDLDDPMTQKMVNDTVAYIRGLAKLRGRNEDWAEQAVRTAASLPAEEALEKNVIDIVAINQTDLFQQLDGRTVNVLGTETTINTVGLIVKEIVPDWRNRLLAVITNPNIAYILMLIGIYGLIFEFSNPGAILPGTVGSICLLLALFAFQILPINYAGLALILLGIALMTAEAFEPSFGILGLGGIVAFIAGSIILIDTDLPGYGINIGLIAGFTVSTAAFFILALGLVFKARRNPVVSGMEEMIGAECVALEAFEEQGRVRVHSEIWTGHTNIPMKKGEKARVQAIHGLVLDIAPENKKENQL
ncbi:MAG: nodulation protein NfeD [Gammaproteobacteria bacterium]|nr:MAG: nodulation protein NfeD [Gammaproteobacteria bacterium]